jgi:hypothetical protein
MKKKLWLINVHTRASFGPYEDVSEAEADAQANSHPEDWLIVRAVRQGRKKKAQAKR